MTGRYIYNAYNAYRAVDPNVTAINISSVIADGIARAWDNYALSLNAGASSSDIGLSVYNIARPRYVNSH